jgi:hypothetical protein
MKRLLILIPVLILIVIGALLIYPKVDRFFKERPVANADVLRSEIIASISNPFNQADTLILDTRWMFCGNSDPDELPVVFDTKLEDENFKQLLAKQIDKRVLTMSEFNKVMDTVRKVRFNGEYPPSLWDTCRVGKVAADIKAEQLSPKHIRVYENYLYADIAKSIHKDFVFDGSKWGYSITDTSTQVFGK